MVIELHAQILGTDISWSNQWPGILLNGRFKAKQRKILNSSHTLRKRVVGYIQPICWVLKEAFAYFVNDFCTLYLN